MEPIDMLRELLGLATKPSKEQIEKTWVQIGKMSPEDMTRKRNLFASTVELDRERDLYQKKAAIITKRIEVGREEFWHHLKTTHALPADRNFHLCDDGRILMEPKDK